MDRKKNKESNLLVEKDVYTMSTLELQNIVKMTLLSASAVNVDSTNIDRYTEQIMSDINDLLNEDPDMFKKLELTEDKDKMFFIIEQTDIDEDVTNGKYFQ